MILGKLVFVHVPRCSGTSIEHSLLNGRMVPDGEKHWTASMLKGHLGELWHDCFKFAIVRNPFDRMASLYVTQEAPFCHYNIHVGNPMSEFLNYYRPMPWEYGFTCSDYIDEDLDFVWRFEERDEGIRRINAIIEPEFGVRIDSKVVKRNHPNKSQYFMEYFDPRSIDMMKAMFAADFERWYP
jgi:hypothetical protein